MDGQPSAEELAAYTLTDAQVRALRRFATRHPVTVGEVLFAPGDPEQDLVVVESGEVEVVRPATRDAAEALINVHGPGRFVGELNLLTGQAAYLTARVRRGGTVQRIPRAQFWRIMREEAELSDIILRVFMARRELLRQGEGSRSIEVIGSRWSGPSLSLRNWLARQQVPHTWLDVDDPTGLMLAGAVGATGDDMPVVLTPTAFLRRATVAAVAAHLGLTHGEPPGRVWDLVVVGAGPAGLAATVCAASEGLGTLLVDGVGVGGQAAASSRIENYVGFPSGVAGADLAARALVQAQKFGAVVSTPCAVTGLDGGPGSFTLEVADGGRVHTRSVVIATGASYRSLPLNGWDRFAGVGILYAATEAEARDCAGQPVVVLGGANSAGQAAAFLADHGCRVTLVARGAALEAKMSRYLVDRLEAHPRVDVLTGCAVTELHGDSVLRAVTVADGATGTAVRRECGRLFCFIGARPATSFLPQEMCRDGDGFVRTDRDLQGPALGPVWDLLGRAPLPFETSVPSAFAVGDVRSGSIKRVASAVGEGSAAVASVHRAVRGAAASLV